MIKTIWGLVLMAATAGMTGYAAATGNEYQGWLWFISGFMTCATFMEVLDVLRRRQT